MKPGTVILSRVQQSDGQLKRRPAVVLSIVPPYGDLLICAVSSQTRHGVPGFDDPILRADGDFLGSGLKVDSLIRLGLLATIPLAAAIGELGEISALRLSRLLSRLADQLRLSDPTV